VVRLDTQGNLLWQKCLGGTSLDNGYCIRQTLDGGYIVAGATSSNDGDVTNIHGGTGAQDYWIVKLAPDISTGIHENKTAGLKIYPNPANDVITVSTPEAATYFITDITGREIVNGTLYTGTNTISIAKMAGGLYILRTEGSSSKTYKIIKE